MEPIIDPRCGDFEDDASSTKRRSLLSLAGSLLVEISLPKLALAWFLMLVLPSLLLGLAPLAVSAWFNAVTWKFSNALAEIWPALLLVAVIALGWFGGRPLLRIVTSSFWSLNSLAVEPIYLIAREVLRYFAEKLLPSHATQAQYATMRAAAAAVAGVAICSLALLALMLAWPNSRWKGTLEDLSSLHQLAPVALANSVELVSAYLAAAALYWGITDATMAQPHTLENFQSPPDRGRTWRIAHLSDLHVVGERYGFRIESGRSGPRGNERLKLALAHLAALDSKEPLDAVLITGDMTDAGRSAEWAEFLDALAPHPQLVERVLVLPGNHDLNVADRANPARLEIPTSPNRRLRQLRVLSIMCALQGRRVHVVDYAKGDLGECLADALAPHLPDVTKFADAGRPLVSKALADLWNEVFPMVVPPDTDSGLGIILLNSNVNSQFSFTNALGTISAHQLRGIEIAAAQYPQACWVIGLHHHLVEYPRAGHALAERIGTALINGNWFVRRLRHLANRAVVMHGHRHIDWIGECAGLHIVSAPSPVMEATDDHTTCFYIHSLAAGANGRVSLLPPQRIAVNCPTGAAS
jgi:3',5'-cyclic AMP phosphodiesterase CpdA